MQPLPPVAPSGPPRYLEAETALRMTGAAVALLAALSTEQRRRAVLPLESAERRNWDYRPRDRAGLALGEMDASQQRLAFVLLASGTSRSGFAKAMAIMSHEKVLGEVEGGAGPLRDPDRYSVTLFGDPSDAEPWGWRFEGHHLSVNHLVAWGERVAPTPNFFGANPARVEAGPREGLRILAPEEDLARGLLRSLDAGQAVKAVISPEAPADILTRWEPRVRPDAATGLAHAEMVGSQQEALMGLVRVYLDRVPADVADRRRERMAREGERHIHFAWAGLPEPGQPHYYRVQGPSFLLEYDNTQDRANHIHTVWREPDGDWGEDLLRRHYARAHDRS